MKKNVNSQNENSFDLDRIILYLWSQKITILSFVFVFLILNYFLITSNKEITYRTEISVQAPTNSIYPEYEFYMMHESENQISGTGSISIGININSEFFNLLLNKLESRDNLKKFTSEFLNRNEKELQLLENITKKSNLNDYFIKGKFGFIENNKKNNNFKEYYLVFPEHFKGEIFLNEYVLYTQNVVTKIIKKRLERILNSNLNVLENNIQIAKEIQLLRPLILGANPIDSSNRNRSAIISEPKSLYYQGVTVLENKIYFTKKLIKDLKEIKFIDNTVLDYAKDGVQVSRNILVYNIFAIIIGFLFSISFIYLKNLFKKR